MKASQIRAQAREKLAGKWKMGALMTFVFGILYYLIFLLLNFVPVIGSIAALLISIPISYGFIVSIMKLENNEETGVLDFFGNGFSEFGRSWKVNLWIFFKAGLPMLLAYIVLISATLATTIMGENNIFILLLVLVFFFAIMIYFCIKLYSFQLAFFILKDNPDITAKAAVEKSAELMKGNMWSYFCLQLSFIGWAILSVFTLYIGYFWLIPYMQFAQISFYKNLLDNPVSEE